jgi:hypothetical protein
MSTSKGTGVMDGKGTTLVVDGSLIFIVVVRGMGGPGGRG